MEDLQRWCIRNRLYADQQALHLAKGKAAEDDAPPVPPSHLLMDGARGGAIHVPPALEGEFLRHLGADVAAGRSHFLHEIRTPVTRLYFDMDWAAPAGDAVLGAAPETRRGAVLERVRSVQRALARYYPAGAGAALDVLVCGVEGDPRTTDDGALKLGLHLIFPKLFVDREQALLLRAGAVTALRLHAERSEAGTDATAAYWEKAVDAGRYGDNRSGGLRMLGCWKLTRCKVCNNRPAARPHCVRCAGRGRLQSGRPYAVQAYLCSEGLESAEVTRHLATNAVAALSQAALRTARVAPTPGFRRYRGAPGVGAAAARPPSCGSALALVRRETPEFARIRDLVRRTSPFYASLGVLDVKRATRGAGKYMVRVAGDGSSYCQNVMRDHGSVTIYFEVSPAGVTQRCFCRCATTDGRLDGLCSAYRSNASTFDGATRDLLFPGARGRAPGLATRSAGLATPSLQRMIQQLADDPRAFPAAAAACAAPARGPARRRPRFS